MLVEAEILIGRSNKMRGTKEFLDLSNFPYIGPCYYTLHMPPIPIMSLFRLLSAGEIFLRGGGYGWLKGNMNVMPTSTFDSPFLVK